jgi:hypothetical protein
MKLQIIYLIIEIEGLSRMGGNTNSIMMPIRQDMFGMNRIRILFSPLRPDRFWAHPAPYPMGMGGLFPQGKAAGA